MNTFNAENDMTIEALTLRVKQILERSASLSEKLADTETTVSSVEKLQHASSFEPTPLSSTSLNSVFPAASAFCPGVFEENVSPIEAKAETVGSPQNLPKTEVNTNSDKTRCPYCDKECDTTALRDHTDACESRQIECEACGEKVELDIFDFHLETCTAALYRQYNGDFFSQPTHNIHHQEGENQQEGNWPEDGEPQGEEMFEDREEDDEEYDGPMSVSDLTYEQLIALDNTIVKKGLTDEELDKCPVEVHLKELDEPVSCNVCLCEAESGEFVRKLPCGHKFHRDCVDTWLMNNITCPSCKKYLR